MQIDDLLVMSKQEIARAFPSIEMDTRIELFRRLTPGDAEEIRSLLSIDVIAAHIANFPRGSVIGPFGDPLPSACTGSTGFATYAPDREACGDCRSCYECFCATTGKYYQDMKAGVALERERQDDIRERAAQAIAGRRAKEAPTFNFDGDLWYSESGRYDVSKILDEDGALDIEAFSAQISGGKRGRLKFLRTESGDRLLVFHHFPLQVQPSYAANGLGYRLHPIEGEASKMTLADWIAHCQANGDGDRQIVRFLFLGYYGSLLPIGWRLYLDAPITGAPRYVWSEYQESGEDAALVARESGR